jgi:simple sugar transport system permease protein
MSEQTSTPTTAPGVSPAHEIQLRAVTVVDRKAPTMFAILTIGLALIVGFGSQEGDTSFRLAVPTDFFELPTVTVPSTATTWLLVLVCAALAAYSFFLLTRKQNTRLWLVVLFALAWMTGFLAWAGADATLPVVGLLAGSLAVAVPLVFGAMGGVLGERSGVVNIALDGQLLFGAFAAAMIGSLTGSTWAGLGAAMVAGLLVAAVLGVFAISYMVDQVIVGVVLNVLSIGITSFMFSQVLAPNAATLNHPPRFERWAIPVLGDIPLVGPIFFRQTPIVYLLYIAVALVTWALYRTKWGLRVRAVGEHPKAADTVGIKVNRTRFRTILLGGAIAGMGGAFYTLVSVPQFNREMTGGAGYIALAAVIFGKWDPIRATLAALLFGFASNLQGVLSVIGSPVPSQFMLMLPYVVTIFAVAGLVGRSRAPAADGIPYRTDNH